MQVQLVEIRDRMTMIPALAIRLSGSDGWLLWKAGFALLPQTYVILIRLSDMEARYDPFAWDRSTRTMHVAHKHLVDNWDKVMGDRRGLEPPVIDVEFVLGETPQKKRSEYVSRLVDDFSDHGGAK